MIICLALVLGMGVGNAQKKGKQMKTVVYSAEISCNDCAKKIMDNVPSLGKGIDDVQVSVEEQTVMVTFDPTKNNEANILKGLNTLKVNAQPAGAQQDPYCKIPPVKQKAKGCADCKESKSGGCGKKHEGCETKSGGCDKKHEGCES